MPNRPISPIDLRRGQAQYVEARNVRDLRIAAAHQEGMTVHQIKGATGLHLATIQKIIRQLCPQDQP